MSLERKSSHHGSHSWTLVRAKDTDSSRRYGRVGNWLPLLVALSLLSGCVDHDTRVANWVEIPAGYEGYLVVQFQNPTCPALERRDGYQVIRFGQDGRACASNRFVEQEGVARDHFSYVYADGTLVELRDPDIQFGTMYGGDLYRMSGSVFARPHANPYADKAIATCAWDDIPCWRPLRDAVK